MYTRCPHCLTVFLVGAEQLKAAHGNVRCGTCFESFDAIPYLSDGPMIAPPTSQVDDSAPSSVDDSRSASEKLSATLDVLRAANPQHDNGSSASAGALAPDTSEPTSSDDGGALEAPPDESLAPAADDQHKGSNDTGRSISALEDPAEDVDERLPAVLREDAEDLAASQLARRHNIGYGVAALALLMLMAGQYVFFMPVDAARRYPQWRGAIESLCMQVGCVLPERRDPTRIRVVSRDVRVHPIYEGVLQIKATLTNAAPHRQPYPRVRFTLFNVNGQTIAARVFQPSEYLGRPVSASARLRPQTPFQVALDVLAPEEAAVSFEFQFL